MMTGWVGWECGVIMGPDRIHFKSSFYSQRCLVRFGLAGARMFLASRPQWLILTLAPIKQLAQRLLAEEGSLQGKKEDDDR